MAKAIPCRKRRHAWHLTRNDSGRAQKNREFNASSRQARSIVALIALLATFLVLASIDGLSQHHGTEAQMTSAKPLSVAQR
jgi:hypothetical protein